MGDHPRRPRPWRQGYRAIGDVGGMRLLEKDLTLEVSKRVVELLKSSYPDRNILITAKATAIRRSTKEWRWLIP